MLGTFSFETYFKSYLCFTVWSLEISEIAKQSIFFHLRQTPLLALPPACRHAARRSGPPPRATSCSRWLPCVAQKLPTALCHRAVPLLALPHATAEPSSRHLAVAVDSPGQSSPPSSSERPSTTHTPEIDSIRSFALPLPSHRKTPPPPRLNAGELTPPRSRLTAAPPPALTP